MIVSNQFCLNNVYQLYCPESFLFFGGVNHCGFSESLNDIQITIGYLIDHIRHNAIYHSETYAYFLVAIHDIK